MNEARDRMDLDNMFFDEYDSAVRRINARWKLITKFRWYNPDEFWKRGKESMAPKPLEPMIDESRL